MINQDYKRLIHSFLSDRSLRFEVVEAESRCRFHFGFKGFDGAFNPLKMLLALDEDVIQVFVYLPITAESNAVEMACLVAVLNYGLKLGKFELNIEDGSVRYQFGQNVNILSADAARDALEAMIYQSPLFVDRFSNILEEVASGRKLAKDVLHELKKLQE